MRLRSFFNNFSDRHINSKRDRGRVFKFSSDNGWSNVLLSRGLIRTGAVGFITEIVLKLSRGKKELTFILIFVTVDFASAFINNTPVVVLFIPIAIIGTVFLYAVFGADVD